MLHPSFRPLPDPRSRLVPRALQARGRQTTAPWLNPAPCPAFVCTGNLARRQPGAPTCLVSTVAGASAGDTKPRQFSIWPRRECPDPCTSSLSSWPVPPALRGQPPSSPEAPHGGGAGPCQPQQRATTWENLFRIFSVPDSLCSDSRCADDPLCDLGECVSLSELLLWTFTMRTILLPARRGSCED